MFWTSFWNLKCLFELTIQNLNTTKHLWIFVYHRIVVLFLKSSSQCLLEWNEMLTMISYPLKALAAYCCIALFHAWLDTFFCTYLLRKRSLLWGSFFLSRFGDMLTLKGMPESMYFKLNLMESVSLAPSFQKIWCLLEFAFFSRLLKMTFC